MGRRSRAQFSASRSFLAETFAKAIPTGLGSRLNRSRGAVQNPRVHPPGRLAAHRAGLRPAIVSLACLAAILLVAAHADLAYAKRVICIDGAGDAFLNNAEGYYRANPLPGDVISVGGNLTDCLAQVADGDQIVIVAHGGNNGATFTWGGMQYTGFGGGQGTMPVPPGFNMLRRVDAQLVWCYSARDPDGDGPDRTFRQKMVDALGGPNSGNTAGGYLNAVIGRVSFGVRGGTRAQQEAALKCLTDDPSWMNNPPVNRPGAQTTQQTAAQAEISNNCPGAGGAVTVVINNREGNGQQTGYWHPFSEVVAAGCGCEMCPDCGCPDAIGYPEDDPTSTPHATWGRLKLIYR